MSLIYSADAWRLLQGIMSVYKPPGMGPKMMVKSLKMNLIKDLNKMERRVHPGFLLEGERTPDVRKLFQSISQTQFMDQNLQVRLLLAEEEVEDEDAEPKYYQENFITQSDKYLLAADDDKLDSLQEDKFPEPQKEILSAMDYASHPLVLGNAYGVEDISVVPVNIVSTRCSGVMVLGINKYTWAAKQMRRAQPLLTYELEGEFGKATATGFSDSKVTAKATWRHLIGRRWHLDQILSSIESSHQKAAWKVANVDPSTQEGYELAAKGPIKPGLLTDPLIYGIKSIAWKPPNFTLRVQFIGHDHTFLLDLVSEIGLRLRTHAHVTRLRCAQVGHFGADQTMLAHQFSLQNALSNIGQNHKIFKSKKPHLKRSNFVSIDQDHKQTDRHAEKDDDYHIRSPRGGHVEENNYQNRYYDSEQVHHENQEEDAVGGQNHPADAHPLQNIQYGRFVPENYN